MSITKNPFVVARMVGGGGFRIEVEVEGYTCPALPDLSVHKFLDQYEEKYSRDENDVATLVKILNQKVQDGVIVQKGNVWVMKGY